MTPAGFPHSEIPGSMPANGSPRLIAASHVLHRRLAPRHPPFALCSLTINLIQPLRQIRCIKRTHPAILRFSAQVIYPYSIVKEQVSNSRRLNCRPEAQGSGLPEGKPTALCFNAGGADRDRTDDLLVANQALSHLSYSPFSNGGPR